MSNELVPVDNMAALEGLDQQAREVAVTHMLIEARAWLAHADEATEPRVIADFKAMIVTATEATKQLNLSKEIQDSASEMVRRFEHRLGTAIRKGQEEGSIRAYRQNQTHKSTAKSVVDPASSPYDFAKHTELYGDGREGGNGVYAMADEATEEEFEVALTAAREEGNLSRSNVVRKIRGESGPRSCAFDAYEMALGNLKTAYKVLLASNRTRENVDDYHRIKKAHDAFGNKISKIGKDYHDE